MLLDQPRKAVTLQTELWDARLALSEELERTASDVMAQRTIETTTTDALLKKHRNLTALESDLGHAMRSLCRSLRCKADCVVAQVRAPSITADSGVELSDAELDNSSL
jgi:hypothetical protein